MTKGRNADPNGAGLPACPIYLADDRRSLVLDAVPFIGDASPDTKHRALWGDAESPA